MLDTKYTLKLFFNCLQSTTLWTLKSIGMKEKMSQALESEADQFEHYDPQHPLPAEIRKMERDETVCKYCGVSYLIHNEIKALEEKLKATEAKLEDYLGMKEREGRLKTEIEQLRKESLESHSNSVAKDAVILSLKNTLKSEEEAANKVRLKNKSLEDLLEETVKIKEKNTLKLSLYEQRISSVHKELCTQKTSLKEIHKVMEEKDQKMKEELTILLSNITDRYNQELKGKASIEEELTQLKSVQSQNELQTVAMKTKVQKQEQELKQLAALREENSQLAQHLSDLQISNNMMKDEVTEAVSKSRHLTMECQQFKDQLRNKSQEVDEILSQSRKREQNTEQSVHKLQVDLKNKDTDLQKITRDFKSLESRLHEQQRKEEESHRKAAMSVNESQEVKELLNQTKSELEQLKSERESMIMSHQNRIEQLRESFKQKINEANAWPEKIEEALQKERATHAAALRSLEERLKENFVMELQIEKQKYQEILGKYQDSNKEHEVKLKSQLNAIESKYQSELKEHQKVYLEAKERAQETEMSLREEIQSLKGIIQNLENRLGRFNSDNDETIEVLKRQLKETKEILDISQNELASKEEQLQTAKNENVFLQETVQKECEERFELTEKLSEAREQLLQLKKPAGGYSSRTQQSPSFTSTKKPEKAPEEELTSPTPSVTSMSSIKSPPPQPIREGTYTTSNSSINYTGEAAKGSGHLKGSSLAENRRRIALLLGRKSSS